MPPSARSSASSGSAPHRPGGRAGELGLLGRLAGPARRRAGPRPAAPASAPARPRCRSRSATARCHSATCSSSPGASAPASQRSRAHSASSRAPRRAPRCRALLAADRQCRFSRRCDRVGVDALGARSTSDRRGSPERRRGCGAGHHRRARAVRIRPRNHLSCQISPKQRDRVVELDLSASSARPCLRVGLEHRAPMQPTATKASCLPERAQSPPARRRRGARARSSPRARSARERAAAMSGGASPVMSRVRSAPSQSPR